MRLPLRSLRLTAVAVTALVAVPLTGSDPASASTGVLRSHVLTTAPTASRTTLLSAADTYERRLLALTNAARTARGLRPLVQSGCATYHSGVHAYRLAQLGRLVHSSMLRLATTCGASAAGENVAYGNVSADEMFRMWMASPTHRANILRAEWKSMGMGAYRTRTGRWYGVQQFLRA